MLKNRQSRCESRNTECHEDGLCFDSVSNTHFHVHDVVGQSGMYLFFGKGVYDADGVVVLSGVEVFREEFGADCGGGG